MCVWLILFAYGIAFNIFLHILCKAWLSEFGGNKLTGFEINGVTGSLMVMATDEDRVVEGVL